MSGKRPSRVEGRPAQNKKAKKVTSTVIVADTEIEVLEKAFGQLLERRQAYSVAEQKRLEKRASQDSKALMNFGYTPTTHSQNDKGMASNLDVDEYPRNKFAVWRDFLLVPGGTSRLERTTSHTGMLSCLRSDKSRVANNNFNTGETSAMKQDYHLGIYCLAALLYIRQATPLAKKMTDEELFQAHGHLNELPLDKDIVMTVYELYCGDPRTKVFTKTMPWLKDPFVICCWGYGKSSQISISTSLGRLNKTQGHRGGYEKTIMQLDHVDMNAVLDEKELSKHPLHRLGNCIEDEEVKTVKQQNVANIAHRTRAVKTAGYGAAAGVPAQIFSLSMLWTIFSKVMCGKAPPMRHLRIWTMIVIGISLFTRFSELAFLKCCDIRIMENDNVRGSPYPQRIQVKLTLRKQDRVVWVWLNALRNPAFWWMCPVRSLLNWIALSGVKTGLLFPPFVRGNSNKIDPSYNLNAITKTGELLDLPCVIKTGNLAKTWTSHVKNMVQDAGLVHVKFTTHSIKHTAVMWTSLFDVTPGQIRVEGRWSSKSFDNYDRATTEGITDTQRWAKKKLGMDFKGTTYLSTTVSPYDLRG